MRILYNFENKILVKNNTIRTDVCSKARYPYNLDRSPFTTYALFPDGTVQALDLGGNLFEKSSIEVVSDIREDHSLLTETLNIVNLDTCNCDKNCVFAAIYNVFGLDCISTNDFEIENGGLEQFGLSNYSLMQYMNIRARFTVYFHNEDHSLAWKTSIGAFREATLYYNGLELNGYIDFSTLTFTEEAAEFDIVAKLN